MYKRTRPCARVGCPKLVTGGAYCEKHKKPRLDRFKSLNRSKSPEKVKFYGSGAWKKTRSLYLKDNPLCEECRELDRIRPAVLVHHDPELTKLWELGLDPLNYKYLHSLCEPCHQRHLNKKSEKG